MLLRKIVTELEQMAEKNFKERRSLNCSVLFDEAGPLIPARSDEDTEVRRLTTRMISAVDTTRKYGLGWGFITQGTNSIPQRIYDRLRVRFFGYGLTSGGDLDRLSDLTGGRSRLELYRTFVDPATIREYPFMAHGPISPLSVAGAPSYFTAFDCGRFAAANPKLCEEAGGEPREPE